MRRSYLLQVAMALWLVALGRDGFETWVTSASIPPLLVETSAEVHDRNGALLRAYTVADGRWRLKVGIEQVEPRYIAMLIAYEDKRFYTHAGVDPLAMARAATQAVWHRRVISGGSTLTMQVARLLEDGPTGSWAGKLRQIRVALALERRLSKAEILELYLNRAPFGGNLEGVRAATRAYFGKDPRRLTPAESALLVALPQLPEGRRPDRYAGRATDARDRVLERLAQTDLLDTDTVSAAQTEPVPHKRRPFPSLAPHLGDRLLRDAPYEQVHVTTLDAELQRRLEALASRAAREAGQRQSIAVMVADHRGGEVLASVGSAGYFASARAGFVDMTRAVRSPGSTLKPLIYGLAFDQGLIHPETLIDDRPVAFGSYAPQNFDGQFRGTVRVRDALQLSLNIPVVLLTEALGPARLIAHLRRAGVTAELQHGQTPGLAVALGGVGMSLKDLVQLYAGIARGGVPIELTFGAKKPAKEVPVLSEVSAWHIGDVLSGIAPPSGAQHSGVAYKTGTSYGHRDAWAIGYDGAHVIGVWMGRPDGTPVPGAFGGEVAAPILFEVFANLKHKAQRLPPPPPAALLVSHSQLPTPLKHFSARETARLGFAHGPIVTFPPDGARLSLLSDGLPAKVRDGRAPFTWLADGAPLITGSYDREVLLNLPGRGFVTLSVVDAQGRSARSQIRID